MHCTCKQDVPSLLQARILTVPTSCGSCILFGWRSGSLFTRALLYLFNPCLGILPHPCTCRPAWGLAGCGLLLFGSGSLSSRSAGLWAARAFFLFYRSRDGTRALWHVRNKKWNKNWQSPRQTDRQTGRQMERWTDDYRALGKPIVSSDYKFWVSTVRNKTCKHITQLDKVDKTKWHFKPQKGRKSFLISMALSCKFIPRTIRSWSEVICLAKCLRQDKPGEIQLK